MAKFIYLYRGPATPMSDRTPEQGAERQAAFGAWMEKVGAALVDVGSPFGTSASVRDDGTEGTAGDLIGYTLVEAGLTPLEALRTATVNPAQFLGLKDMGTIAPGMKANLVLLDANPVENIANTKKISSVIMGGTLYTRSQLDDLLNSSAKVASTQK